MIIVLILLLTGILLVAALRSTTVQVPWAHRLQRVNAGSATQAEWIAPEPVLQQVEKHYLETLYWLQDATTAPATHREEASHYLTGNLLRRFYKQADYDSASPGIFTGILRADHALTVRHFSDDGKRCVVMDTRTEQRMASYDSRTHHRLLTQHMGAETVVYSMAYDIEDKRWKVETYIQSLPTGWQNPVAVRRIKVQSTLSPSTAGRDA